MSPSLFDTYARRFAQSGLDPQGEVLMAVAGPRVTWNRDTAAEIPLLEPLFDMPGVKALVWLRPAEPYFSIINYLAGASGGTIYPRDCETRLFLQDLPVAARLEPDQLADRLKHRKSVLIAGSGIVATSRRGLKQAFVTASSVCFACFVKFFGDLLHAKKAGELSDADRRVFESVRPSIQPPHPEAGPLAKGPFPSEETILPAIYEAGRRVVDLRLVDSCFGNISYCTDDRLYISQSGAFLDDLKGRICACPTDPAARPPANASSELPAHLEIVRQTGCHAILHGHPLFSVILSMDCDIPDCTYRGTCHRYCPYNRQACGHIPIVSGEVGGGTYGLCHRVPKALCRTPGAIVYGHGVFTCDATDFNGALAKLLDIEGQCCREYFKQMSFA